MTEVNKLLDIIPSAEEREQIHQILRKLPDNESIFKCHRCKVIFDIFAGGLPVFMALSGKDGIICPECKSDSTELMCKVDAYSIYLKLSGKVRCREGVVINGTDICPICQDPICPECYNHSVVSLSRVTGYLQDISGWNAAKKQELEDRKRYVMNLENHASRLT